MYVDVVQVRDCLIAGWESKIWAGVLSSRLREKKPKETKVRGGV